MDSKTAEDGDHQTMDEKTPFNKEEEFADEKHDSSKVNFVNGGANADVEIKIPEKDKKDKDNDFSGLSKQELLEYANDPFWVRTRLVLLVLFWVAWIGMLVAAIIIIITAPRCAPRPDLDWWQKSVGYQIYPRSFRDSDGDGHGDLKGIHEKLDDLQAFNVSAIWLNPIYPSTDLDWGYDITNFVSIHPDFGTMADFDSLVAAIHKKGMYLIMDYVPNHTSRNHTWFQESRKGADNQYSDYYVWVEGNSSTPPTNWRSVFGKSAWTYDEVRGAWYYHQFLPEQPDLNMRSEAVQNEMKDVLLFWMNKKVDGFRIDAVSHLYESSDLDDEELIRTDTDDYADLSHNKTKFLPESYELVTKWRKLMDDFSKDEGLKHPRLMMVEATGEPEQTMGFYKHDGENGAHMPMNFQLAHIDSSCNAQCLHTKIRDWLDSVPSGKWTNWRTGNHDNSRIATRMGRDAINAMNMLTMTLPGTQFTYYGEELGMVDVDVSFEETQDEFAKRKGEDDYMNWTRDPQRTPMQWSPKRNAGFSTADETWLPVADDYADWNIQTQQAHGSGQTNVEVYRDLTTLRSEPSMMWGEMIDIMVTDDIIAYLRKAEGFDTFLVAINLGDGYVTANLRTDTDLVPSQGFIVASTKNFGGGRAEAFKAGTVVDLSGVKLNPNEGVIFGWHYTAPGSVEE